jgi:acyl-CoA hydrolase
VEHKENEMASDAYFTIVIIDDHAKPAKIPGSMPVSR